MREYALIEGFKPGKEFAESEWFEAIAARNYHTPMYGEVPVTVETLQRMVKSFKEKVRGQDIATNYDHGVDVAKGNKASGWFRDFDIRPSSDGQGMSLYTKVEFTEEAQKEISNGEWKYFSLEWDDWMDNNGNVHPDVIIGGAITNRPVAKHMQSLPVNFSESMWNELDPETKRVFSEWTTAFVDTLSDSAFLFVEPGGTKDSEGKTQPRSNRHFPYKGVDGKVDLPHLRNAIARIPQSGNWLSENVKHTLQTRAKAMLSAANKQMSESAIADVDTTAIVDLVGEVFDESKEWEHSEPGTGSPPAPRTDEDGSDDPAIGGGWRRSPLPLDPNDPNAPHTNQGDVMELTEEQVKELLKHFELGDDATPEKLLEVASKSFSEAKSLRDALGSVDESKKFAEQYPAMFAEHQRLKADNAMTTAKNFSESVARQTKTEGDVQVETGFGLSSLAKEKIQETHIKFSEGTATARDLEEVVSTIMHGGFVKFGEAGSTANPAEPVGAANTSTAEGVQENRKRFAEIVAGIQKEDNVDLKTALQLAAEKNPELAKAYRATAAA